jgi:hypothetical protein
MIKCPRCGRNYRRITNKGRAAWNCPTFVQYDKKACHGKQIPEDILFALTADVLGLDDFDEKVYKEEIKEMIIPGPGRVVYLFQDGHKAEAPWKNRSRKFSWTDQAKQKAREKTLAYQRGVKQ